MKKNPKKYESIPLHKLYMYSVVVQVSKNSNNKSNIFGNFDVKFLKFEHTREQTGQIFFSFIYTTKTLFLLRFNDRELLISMFSKAHFGPMSAIVDSIVCRLPIFFFAKKNVHESHKTNYTSMERRYFKFFNDIYAKSGKIHKSS